jgi:hypothetical protein
MLYIYIVFLVFIEEEKIDICDKYEDDIFGWEFVDITQMQDVFSQNNRPTNLLHGINNNYVEKVIYIQYDPFAILYNIYNIYNIYNGFFYDKFF